MNAPKCNCTPPGDPSVIGACACPVHGMKALRALLAEAQRNLSAEAGRGDLSQRIRVTLQIAKESQP